MPVTWVQPHQTPTGEAWRCPRCGDAVPYGSKRSLWSLLPFVCIHLPLRWDELLSRVGAAAKEGLVHADVGRSVRVDEGHPIWDGRKFVDAPLREQLAAFLRHRLRDEILGYRRYWWSPLTAERQRQLDLVEQRRREYEEQQRSRGPEITDMCDDTENPFMAAGNRGLERFRQQVASR